MNEKEIRRIAYRAAGLTYDKALDEELDNKAQEAVLSFLEGKLSSEDLEQVRTLFATGGASSDPVDMASDAVMRRRRESYNAGRISLDQLHSPLPLPPASAADAARRREMFPDCERLN